MSVSSIQNKKKVHSDTFYNKRSNKLSVLIVVSFYKCFNRGYYVMRHLEDLDCSYYTIPRCMHECMYHTLPKRSIALKVKCSRHSNSCWLPCLLATGCRNDVNGKHAIFSWWQNDVTSLCMWGERWKKRNSGSSGGRLTSCQTYERQ